MAGSTIEKALCEQCGVETRENTQFCYNCGAHLTDDVDSAGSVTNDGVSASEAALADLAARLDASALDETDKLSQAAEQRRKARVIRRQPKQFEWVPADDSSGLRILVLALIVAFTAVIVVYLAVYWK